MWVDCRRITPWHAPWADEFVAVANGDDGKMPAKGDDGKMPAKGDDGKMPAKGDFRLPLYSMHEPQINWKAKISGMHTLMVMMHGEVTARS